MLADNGCWQDYRAAPQKLSSSQAALFLDRDGVVVEEVEYLHTAEQTKLLPGAAELILAANKADWLCGMITNQSGIARGFFDWLDFQVVQDEIDRQLARAGAKLDFVLACPYYETAKVKRYQVADHPWRKPNPGMIVQILDQYKIDPKKSILVGDKTSDLEAGEKAGIATLIHVLTGHGRSERELIIQSNHWQKKVLKYNSLNEPEIISLITENQTS